ncbi:hypothetical protein [Mangrovicoccus ximenensis]|uniref:hypothetical protein n=1 Tax=Mangrovicoccus ximenensis TaxID=1911570 RepID=UPI0011AE6DB2|nr:hypothetical protein [Mangrovicoccus ximenensis]
MQQPDAITGGDLRNPCDRSIKHTEFDTDPTSGMESLTVSAARAAGEAIPETGVHAFRGIHIAAPGPETVIHIGDGTTFGRR